MTYREEATARGAAFLDGLATKSDVPLEDLSQTRPRVISLEIGELLSYSFPLQEPLLGPWLRKQSLAMVHAWRGIGKTHCDNGPSMAHERQRCQAAPYRTG